MKQDLKEAGESMGREELSQVCCLLPKLLMFGSKVGDHTWGIPRDQGELAAQTESRGNSRGCKDKAGTKPTAVANDGQNLNHL